MTEIRDKDRKKKTDGNKISEDLLIKKKNNHATY